MNQSNNPFPSAIVMLLTVAAGAICVFVCGLAAGTFLSLIPAALLVRYVIADFEGAMAAAVLTMAGLALLALDSGPVQFLVAIGGAFVAAELTALAARLHRTGTDAELRRRLIDVGRTVVSGVGALVIGGLVTLVRPSTGVAVGALVIVASAVVGWWAISLARTSGDDGTAPDAR